MDTERQNDTGDGDAVGDDALVSQLRLIEDQPLDQRAESYTALSERLRERLEGSDGGTVD